MNGQPNVVRSIAIYLDGFEHVHAPFGGREDVDHLFVGRKDLIVELVDLLKSKSRRGSYLIAGYRGAGKTSVVNEALDRYQRGEGGKNGGKNNVLEVRINLGDNSQLAPLNIYYSIASILRDKITYQSCPLWERFLKCIVAPRTIGIITLIALAVVPPIGWFNSELLDDYFYYVSWLYYFLILVKGAEWGISQIRHPELRVLKQIDDLIERLSSEISEGRSGEFKLRSFRFGLSKQRRKLPINAREAEELLSKILQRIQKSKVVLVMDEIDKLSNNEELSEIEYYDKSNDQEADKISRINTLLSSLKNFITTAHATFFFISGRETFDRYYSEKASSNSLYESLFDRVFEVPSFLTHKERAKGTQLSALIEEYVCRRIRKKRKEGSEKESEYYTLRDYRKSLETDTAVKKTDIDRCTSTLRNFIQYLTFYSWGNPKRLSSIFESFIVLESAVPRGNSVLFMREMETAAEKTATNKKEAGGKTGYCLHFNANDLRSFSLASEIVTLFQHQLSREVSKISDKLIVSAFSSLHFILKMHLYGFTRESLHRMSEAINVYRSPELNTIVDDLLTHVFKSYIRRVRNGIYRYRFSSGFEQELRYISQIHELESATYNFSLDSMRYVKRFFENILVKSDSEKTGLISRSHITLGEMCAIEQSYTAASVHYSAASQILAKKLSKMRSPLNQEVLMLYTEAMIKHGDLEERRQNYNYAAAIYSDAESTIKTLSSDPELAASLQKGDSKWDLLKQPFWASRFLSLKRSPSPGRVESPRYLYQKRDPRFHYRAANLSFFLGEAASAAKFYSTTRRYANKSIDSQLPDERSGYLDGKAMVGLVESILMYQSRELFKILSKRELSTTEKKQEFEKKLLDNFRGVRDDRNIAHQLNKAAKRFEENRLYISAAITHIKAICYYTAILDAFDNSTFSDNDDYKRELLRHTNEIYKGIIITSGADAIRCIDKARQLETSQSNKTLLIYDFEYKHGFAEKDITMLFDMLFGSGVAQDYPANESLFWQNSVWAHKLIATLYWAEYVKRKIEQEAVGFESSKKIPGNIPRDLSVSGFSVRSSILMCWIHARDLSRRYIDKKLVVFDEKPRHRNVIHNLFEKAEKARLTATGEEIAAYLRNFQNKEIPLPETLEKAYLISRYLYFAQKSSRMISRKNLDLIFPRLSQIHYTQWKLLQNLISTMFVKPGEISEDFSGSHQMNSVRDISFLVQRAFVAIDEKLEPDERIAPSHFDFEFISMRLNDSLESSISLVDRTSRTHTGIFQHKYFCHDDHGDPDFRMDYTLAQMFTPMAQYLYLELKETDPMLKSILALSSRKVASCIN